MRVVVALGGNALLRRGEPPAPDRQRHNATLAARSVGALAREHEVVVTHGNGPQVGLLAQQNEACGELPAFPLDVLDAETEGMIGYLLQQELRNQLPGREAVSLLTQTLVDAEDPAFAAPTKPIGAVLDRPAAEALRRRGHVVAPEPGGFRRVVASPEPRGFLELEPIRLLLAGRVLVICAGGGGIPVRRGPEGRLEGVEAVVDKDLAAALLARQLGADALLLLTDVEAVFRDFGSGRARALRRLSCGEARALGCDPGSMGPKLEAAARFAEAGGRAGIGRLEEAAAVLAGAAGTRIEA